MVRTGPADASDALKDLVGAGDAAVVATSALEYYRGDVHLRHLGLPVRDCARSIRFYSRYFAFDPGTAQWYPDGTVIVRNPDGFDLALHQVRDVDVPSDFLHFGFAMDAPDGVRALRERLVRHGVSVIETDDEPRLVAFKCLDPDGWPVEVYWEPPASPRACG